MAEEVVTNELMHEILKELQAGQYVIKEMLYGIKDEISALRTHMAGFQTDIGNLYASQNSMNKELERVQRRLNLTDEIQ